MSLIISNLAILLNGKHLLNAISADVHSGEILTLMGPSGIGKSTILAAISGSLSPNLKATGQITLNDQDITTRPMHQRHVGMLYQDPLLFPHLNVEQNLLFGMPSSVPNRKEQALLALRNIGLDGFATRDPATVSGGEAARIALQRALLAEPQALLLDEPFSKLDTNTRSETRTLIFDEIRRRQIPAILVTHDQADAEVAQGEIIKLSR